MTSMREETISFPEFHKELGELRQARCIEEEDDIVICFVGAEGSGKSTGSLGLGSIDPGFHQNYIENHEQIYFLWSHFLQANDDSTTYAAQTKGKALSDLNNAQYLRSRKLLMDKYKLTEDDLMLNPSKTPLPPGSYRQYDESGTQMFNRDALSTSVKDQVKMFIANRSNRGIYALNVPKAHYVDKYIREERMKYLIYFKKTYEGGDIRNPKRVAYIWGKDRINLMRSIFHGYWTTALEIEFGKVYSRSPPNFRIQMPNLIGKYIDETVNATYQLEKTYFQKHLSKEMRGEGVGEEKNNKDKMNVCKLFKDSLPQYGEKAKEYMERTKKTEKTYYHYIKLLRSNLIWPSPTNMEVAA